MPTGIAIVYSFVIAIGSIIADFIAMSGGLITGGMVCLTAFLAAIDASKIGLKKYKTNFANSPIEVFVAILLVWFIAFPWYLSLRYQIRKDLVGLKDEANQEQNVPALSGEPFSSQAGLKLGLIFVIVAGILIVQWLYFGNSQRVAPDAIGTKMVNAEPDISKLQPILQPPRESSTTSSTNAKPTTNIISIKDSDTLKVKGFYIGMKIDEAVKLLNDRYKNTLMEQGLHCVLVKNGERPPADLPAKVVQDDGRAYYYFDHFIRVKNEIGNYVSPVHIGNVSPFHIEADESGKVIRISFDQYAVDKLFNVKDMDAESFAQTFINNYSIPKLTYFGDDESFFHNSGWYYTSDKGFKVTITDKKCLIIEKIASGEERKFD